MFKNDTVYYQEAHDHIPHLSNLAMLFFTRFPHLIYLWWPCPTPWGHYLENVESTLPQDTSTLVSAFLPQWFLKRFFLSIFQCKSWIYYNGPLLPKGVMILIIRNLHYPKMLPHKFQLFESISQTFLFLVKWQHSLLKSKTYTQNYVSLCSLLMCQVIFKSDQNCRRSSI